MTMQVEIGRDITMSVDVDGLPANVMQHVVYIGLRNILMDAHAGAAKLAESATDGSTVEAIAQAMADKKLAAMMAGELRAAGTGGGRTADPVKREAMLIAVARIQKAWKAQPANKSRKWIKVDQTVVRTRAKELIGRDATIMVEARDRVAALAATVDATDVTGL